jgi:hypothetical protein
MTDRVSLLPAVTIEAAPDPLQAQFIEIAQNGQPPAKGADAHSDAPKIDVGDALFNSALNIDRKQIVGQGFKDSLAASKAFMAPGDKTEALAKGAPAFEAAIKQSDADYISAIAKYSPDYDQKRHDLGDAQMAAVMTMEGLKGAFKSVPEERQEEVSHLIALASDKNTSTALKASVLKEMDQFPGMRKSYETTQTALDAEQKALGEMTKAAQPLVHAAYEQAATRYLYAHAMELGGEKAKGYLLKQEGESKITDAYFEYLDEPKPPKPMLKV